MKTKLIMELKNLARDILQLDEQAELDLLREKIQGLYERLAVLDYFDKASESPDEVEIENEQVEEKNEFDFEKELKESTIDREIGRELERNSIKSQEQELIKSNEVDEKHEEIENESLDVENLFVPTFESIKDDFSQKEEFKDTVSLDETEKLFETKKVQKKQLSLNDRLLKNSIQVGLNDRIAFVNNLFNYSQSEFNNTLSILNNFESESEAKTYIKNTLKIKFNWNGKEEIEERFILLVERKFL